MNLVLVVLILRRGGGVFTCVNLPFPCLICCALGVLDKQTSFELISCSLFLVKNSWDTQCSSFLFLLIFFLFVTSWDTQCSPSSCLVCPVFVRLSV